MRLRERLKSQERRRRLEAGLESWLAGSRLALMGLKALRWELERLTGKNQATARYVAE